MGLKKTDPEAVLTAKDIRKIDELTAKIREVVGKWKKERDTFEIGIFDNEALTEFFYHLLLMFDSISVDGHIADYVTTVGDKFGVEVPVVWKEE